MSWSDLLPRSFSNRIESVDDIPAENGQVLTVRTNFIRREDAQVCHFDYNSYLNEGGNKNAHVGVAGGVLAFVENFVDRA
jgi:hypothetical protein